ncbi:MAG: polysaccharide deacetylase family protein [Eubacterium sp.]|nr:polysaccharide deacetylase family protein [Eubacterium sp.]
MNKMFKKSFMLGALFILGALLCCCGKGESKDASSDSGVSADASSDVIYFGDESADASSDAAASSNASASADADEGSEEDSAIDLSHGIDYEPEVIDGVDGLSAEAIPWGYTQDRDEDNRPVTALEFQEKYADYNVDFIVDDADDQIYLTFDEGYENGYTPTILDTLKEKGATGVFFVTMDYVKRNPDLVRRMIDEGHVVGNHTVHHPSEGLQSLSVADQQAELNELHEYVKENFDYDMFVFRYPTGKFSEQSLAVVNNCGYRSVFWSFAYVDWDTENQLDPSEALETLTNALHPGAIYLIHAVSETNSKILGDFIDNAYEKGFTTGDYGELMLQRMSSE